jgi:hypothetical protein
MNANQPEAAGTPDQGLLFFLRLKILITIIFWATPLLLPDPLLDWLTVNILGVAPFEPKVFIHLLGATFAALVVNYQAGVERLKVHKDVNHIVLTGIVSNGLACLLLVLYGLLNSYSTWSLWGQVYMWTSAFLTGFITLGLVLTGQRSSS